MKRFRDGLLAASVLGVLIVSPKPAHSEVDIHISVPPPPAIVFRAEPEVVIVPETRVYYVPQVVDYDMYRYGSYWYVNQGGYWYRGNGYEGPFRVVDYDRVPRQIVTVPRKYRHHPSRPYDDKHRGKHRGKHDGKHDQH